MSNKKISELTSATNLTMTDVVPVVQDSSTYKAPISLITGLGLPQLLKFTVQSTGPTELWEPGKVYTDNAATIIMSKKDANHIDVLPFLIASLILPSAGYFLYTTNTIYVRGLAYSYFEDAYGNWQLSMAYINDDHWEGAVGGDTAYFTVAPFYLPSTTTQGNTFNGTSQLVQLDGSTRLPAVDGSQLTNITVGPSVTTQGNAFNGASQLVQLDGSGYLPAVDGSNLTGSVTKQGNTFNGASQLLQTDMDGNFQFDHDIYITNNSKGIILKAPGGGYWRLVVADDGTLSTTSV